MRMHVRLMATGLLMIGILAPRTSADEWDTAGTVAEDLYRRFTALESVACEIRKTTRFENRMTRLLSRVYYQRPRRIHVENAAPSQRRIISDGERLYYHEQGNPRGFSQAISDLSGEWLKAIDNVPATPTEHLIKLKGIPEQALPDGPDGERRVGYAAGDELFVVLALDRPGRLTSIAFYTSATMEQLSAVYRYDGFEEVAPGCWIPLRHRGEIHLPDGTTVEETSRITNLSVNEPIAPALFNPAGFFDGVEFVDTYGATQSR